MDDEKTLCHICKVKKKPYTVIMNSDPLSMASYFTARDDGEICEDCWNYYCLTNELKPHTEIELNNAKIGNEFGILLSKWWFKDNEIDIYHEYNNLRKLDTDQDMIKWFETELKNNKKAILYNKLLKKWWNKDGICEKHNWGGMNYISKWCREYLNSKV